VYNYVNHYIICIFAARTVNVAAIYSRNVTLVCNSNVKKPVNWWLRSQSGSKEREVVVNGVVVDGYYDRMTLVGYNLVIHNVMPNDTGVYTCIEDTGFGEHHKISLTVTGYLFLKKFFLKKLFHVWQLIFEAHFLQLCIVL